MKRPLLITDCDEVLLHMVSHFAEWLEAEHDVRFALETGRFTDAMTRVSTGETLDMDQGWILLEAFFRGEMHRQTWSPVRSRRSAGSGGGGHRHPDKSRQRGASLARGPARSARNTP